MFSLLAGKPAHAKRFNGMMERLLPKQDVTGSSPVTRSKSSFFRINTGYISRTLPVRPHGFYGILNFRRKKTRLR